MRVARTIVGRIGHALLSMFVLLLLTFGLVRLAGDPVYFLVPPDASPQQVEFARRQLGLDQPVPVQFAVYVSGVAQGDLGISFRSRSLRTPVIELVQDRIPATLTMA